MAKPFFFFFFVAVVSLHYASANGSYSFMRDAVTAPAVSYHDYIVIGGGTAGCPLSATLSEHSDVLLLERGSSPYNDTRILHLARFGETLMDTSDASPAQRFVSEDGVVNARPRVLGGGSCINAGFYSRASVEEIAAAGWDLEEAMAAYRWVEAVVAFQPEPRQWQSAFRDALLEVGVSPDRGFTFDHVAGTKVGGSIFDQHGLRHTAADLLRYARPESITVLLRARVAKILFKRRAGRRPVAHGVLYRDASGGVHRAYLKKGSKNEIIVSAGAMGSPQLLMLSGIGPKAHLQSFGIDVVLDQPMVGQGMADNPMNAVYVPSPAPVEVSLIQVVGITSFGSYIEAASGGNFAGAIDGGGSYKPAAATDGGADTAFRGGFILEKVNGPRSSGELRLRNRNPDDNPSVAFNYFSHPDDLGRCVGGLKTIERVIQSRAFAEFRFPNMGVEDLLEMTAAFPVNRRARHGNDSTELEQYCIDTVMTIWHYHGGCQQGRVVSKGDYRVVGVDALRVVDGSTFTFSPGTNPQATVMMLGRYMGLKILRERMGN